ncbi:carbon-nitrogen hydrolase family protein [Streptomyces sp. Pv4-95]|uniref:carbon-nitrogen hydrolase family protein n=1 Tax=Streptomyces sp. Pv4-95 TaxID=3049543 RepID=UPI003891D32A
MHVAIVQEPPSILDIAEGVRRAVEHIDAAAHQGAQLIAFPETWLTGYPAWIFGLAGWDDAEARHWYAALLRQCPSVDSPELAPIREAAARSGATVSIGMNERQASDSGTIYNSLLTIGPQGETMGLHRKLTPTHTERIVWAPSPDAAGLRTHDTEFGRLGGLICWEHWQPLIRQSMHSQGEQIHVAAWPDMTDAHQAASRTYAFEGRCFVLAAAQFLRAEDVPDQVRSAYRAGVGPGTPETGVWFAGGSAVAGPDGAWVTEPLFDTPGIVHAEIDTEQTLAYKHDLDVAGHYARPDIFNLTVDRRPRSSVTWIDSSEDEAATRKKPGADYTGAAANTPNTT